MKKVIFVILLVIVVLVAIFYFFSRAIPKYETSKVESVYGANQYSLYLNPATTKINIGNIRKINSTIRKIENNKRFAVCIFDDKAFAAEYKADNPDFATMSKDQKTVYVQKLSDHQIACWESVTGKINNFGSKYSSIREKSAK